MVLGDARAGKFAENLTGFARMLRRAGLHIDTSRIKLAQQALTQIDLGTRIEVQAALESTLVSRFQDRDVFHQLFDAYFKDPEIARQLLAQLLPQSRASKTPAQRSPRAQEALHVINQPNRKTPQPREDEVKLDAAMSASDRERLRHADFEGLSASEYQLVERLAREIPLTVPRHKARRYRTASQGDRIDWPGLMRELARHDGEFLEIARTSRQTRPLPLLVLVDVSGSMERYARLLLAFLHEATHGLRQTRRAVFAFGTRLTDLNKAFRLDDTDAMLAGVNEAVPDFGGGTLISEAIRCLRQQHRQVIVGNRTIALIITDGLDTGDPGLLDEQMAWLCGQARRTVWLNPLLRYDGYQPLAGGAQVLARRVDQMLAIHNLAHLESLASALSQLLHQAKRSRSHTRSCT